MNFVEQLYEMTLDEMATYLSEKDPIFRKLFTEYVDYTNLLPEEQTQAETLYRQYFPESEETLDAFLDNWRRCKIQDRPESPEREDSRGPCPGLVFDPKEKKRYHPAVLKPFKSNRRPNEFDVFKFLTDKERLHEVYRLNIEPNANELCLDMSYEDRRAMDTRADQALRKMAKMVTILNQNCDYKILDLYSERRIT